MPGTLVYHEATYELLGRRPAPSARAHGRLDARERALGVALPPSVREWYAQERRNRHPGRVPRGRRAVPRREARGALGPDAASPDPGMLPFMADNHGGVAYAFGLDGTDDPPVAARDDGGVWLRQGDTFSRYLYIMVWAALAERAPFRSDAAGPAGVLVNLEVLRGELDPVTPALHASRVLRFRREDRYLTIAPDPPDATRWSLGASTAEGLEALLRTVARCGGPHRAAGPRVPGGVTMVVDDIYLIGGPVAPVPEGAIEDAEAALGAPMPDGYAEWLRRLGEGTFQDQYFLYPPAYIVERKDRCRARYRTYGELLRAVLRAPHPLRALRGVRGVRPRLGRRRAGLQPAPAGADTT